MKCQFISPLDSIFLRQMLLVQRAVSSILTLALYRFNEISGVNTQEAVVIEPSALRVLFNQMKVREKA